MYSLIKQAGLIDSLYRGNWKNGKRHGFGVQLFPNGAKFTGTWKKNECEGFGKLEFTDGTLYEGNFSSNFIQSGKLQYFNGTYFEGQFDGTRDLFKSGRIVFRDNEVLLATWSPEGTILTACLFCNDGHRIHLSGKNIVREPTFTNSGKLIYWHKGVIYEGGLSKGNYDKKGFVYGNYRHPFYYESNFCRNRFHGRFLYTSLYYGFSTEEHYSRGKEVGVWRYLTSKGYEYVGDTSTKRHLVRFPFLNKDFYEGELNIWCENITLVSGTYHLAEEQKEPGASSESKLIRVINCDSITTQKDMVKRFNSFDTILDLIEKTNKEQQRSHFESEDGLFFLDDGSTFKGHIVNNFVRCHKSDLLKLLSIKKQGNNRNFEINSIGTIMTSRAFTDLDSISISSLKFFRGTVIEGMKTGFCEVVSRNNEQYKGFYERNLKCGYGFYQVKDKFKFIGYFEKGKMNGEGIMVTAQNDTFKGRFQDGRLKGIGYVKYSNNNLEFFGEMLDTMKNGKGVLKFTNNYRFEGVFSNDVIDTSIEKGKLISKTDETVEEGFYMPSRDLSIGFLRTVEGNDYVFDFKSGVVKKAI